MSKRCLSKKQQVVCKTVSEKLSWFNLEFGILLRYSHIIINGLNIKCLCGALKASVVEVRELGRNSDALANAENSPFFLAIAFG